MPTAMEVFRRAETFDLKDVIARYAGETRLPNEVIQEHRIELLRFLSLCAASPGKYGMRGPIDELWHTFIIFTEKYQNFCESVAGRFIHHFPVPHTDKPHAQPDITVTYQNFLKDYKIAYGHEAPIHVWPRPLPGTLGPSCSQCGAGCDHKCIA